MSYIIGLDIGTTSVKACLFHINGTLKKDVEYMIETFYIKDDWAEQDVTQIEQLCKNAIRDVIEQSKISPSQILAVSFCSAMHSILAVSSKGEPLSHAIIWSDRRSHHIVASMSEAEKNEVYTISGTPVHPMTPFSKLMWIKQNDQHLYSHAAYWMSIKEYIINKWFNVRWIDYSMASATGFLNVHECKWDRMLLAQMGIQESQLSEIYPPQTKLPVIADSVREECGLCLETSFILGSADGQLASLGLGAIDEGEMAISVGTSGAIRQFSNEIRLGSNRETFSYLFDEGRYILGGPTNNGGVVLQWAKQLIAETQSYESFLQLASDVPIGSGGVIFLPYLNGERAPLWDAQAKGSFYGLSINHNKAHIVRAVLEGITFNLYHISQSLQLKNKIECIYVNGGLSRSPVWLQMVADLFGAKVYISHTHHGAAWGACWVALMSLGLKDSYEQIKTSVSYESPIEPIMENHERYKQYFLQYKRYLGQVLPLYH